MSFITDVQQKATALLQQNAPLMLTAGGVVGTVATAVLTAQSTFKAAEIIRTEELKRVHDEGTTDSITDGTMGLSFGQKSKLVWAFYIPPVVIGGLTIGSIVMANRVSAQKAAALAAAYGLAERNLSEYKEKVAEKLTGPKQQAVVDEMAQDRVNRTPGHENIVVVEGEVLCFDEPTARYFRSTMERIRSAVNATNAEILNHDHANATFFYEEIGLPGTSWTDEVGWNRDRLLELKYSTVLSPDNKPCISIDFQYLPKQDYIPKYY